MARKDKLLNTPRGSGGSSGYDSDAFARGAEGVARFLGTGRYLAGQTILVIIWITINVFAGKQGLWDKYPFILLNLAFSTQAAYAAPLILLAQNRQSDRDKDEVQRDRETNARSLAETEFLAREIADIRLTVGRSEDRDGIVGQLERITETLDELREALVQTRDSDDSS